MEKERKVIVKAFDHCPECKSQNLVHDYDSGETICSDCGLVVREQMMDRGPEWRAFTDEEKARRSRVGMPTTFTVHDKGLTTDVGGGPYGIGYDAFGKKLPLATRLQMWRLRKWQIRTRVHTSLDRNLAQAMYDLDRLSDKLTVPVPVKERAAVIYRKAVEKGLSRGRSIRIMIRAALYAACRHSGIIRTLEEVAEGDPLFKKEIANCYRIILKELKIQMPVLDSVTCISKIAGPVGISGESQGLAIRILHQAKMKRIQSGKDPLGLAAAALYSACLLNGEEKTQKEIAEAAQVTEVTIRNRYKELERRLGLNFPKKEPNKNNFGRAKKNSLFFMGLDKIYRGAIIEVSS